MRRAGTRVASGAVLAGVLFGCVLLGCGDSGPVSTTGDAHETATSAPSSGGSSPEPGPSPGGAVEPSAAGDAGALLEPGDLTYLGAFKLPGPSGGSDWSFSGYAATFYPDGDPDGGADGHPGSLFAVGHDQGQLVAEIGIPAPVVSAGKDPDELDVATILQPFADVTGGMFGYLEIPRAALEYLPAQTGQTQARLHFAWGQHLESELGPTHGWASLDLSHPGPVGPWRLDGYTPYVTTDYMCAIPPEWADANTPGQVLATGRFRDGLWSGRGPALLAYAPPNEDEPPAAGATLKDVTPLLLYGTEDPGAVEITGDETMAMEGFGEADEWSGVEWLTTGERSAVVFVGTKALGKIWYGYSNGVEYPTSGDSDEEIPEMPPWPHDQRGWWAESIEAQLLFYDPDDLAAVARGEMQSWEPQPYATMALDEYLFDPGYDYERGKMTLLGDSAFDRQNGYLYVFERMADDDEKSIVHVFEVG